MSGSASSRARRFPVSRRCASWPVSPPRDDPGQSGSAAASRIPEPVRLQALHPFRELPTPPSFEGIEQDGVLIVINPWPGAQIVEPLAPDLDVAAAVGTVREIVRSRGKPIAGWWIAPEHDHLAPMLEELGLVNEDTPGFEAVENAMALVSAPSGAAVNDVEVRLVQSFEEYEAAAKLAEEVFGLPPMPAEERRQRYEEMRASATGRQLIASVEGRIVGSAFAALGAAAVNLFGGGVHPDARGRGVYRALTLARWDLAVERGTPALTVQAGRMSLPICERLGFQLVEPVRLFVDRLDR